MTPYNTDCLPFPSSIYLIYLSIHPSNYLQVVVKALNFVCDVNPHIDHIGADTKLAFFNETRHSYGRTALLLSGGAGMDGWMDLATSRKLAI